MPSVVLVKDSSTATASDRLFRTQRHSGSRMRRSWPPRALLAGHAIPAVIILQYGYQTFLWKMQQSCGVQIWCSLETSAASKSRLSFGIRRSNTNSIHNVNVKSHKLQNLFGFPRLESVHRARVVARDGRKVKRIRALDGGARRGKRRNASNLTAWWCFI